MKKFINAVADAGLESLRGFADAHGDIVTLNEEPLFVARRRRAPPGKVALLSGGGGGHEPLHCGFVGTGMLDAACPGEIFTSPAPGQILAAAQAADSGGGTLFIVKNYPGDVMNFEMAMEAMSGHHRSVLVADDVSGRRGPSSAALDEAVAEGCRGVAGTLVVEKIAGAAAEAGGDLDACHAVAQRVSARTRSIGVALTSCTVPAVGRPTFALGAAELEMGVGIHGEPGRQRRRLDSADAIARDMAQAVAQGLDLSEGDRVLMLVNGFGGTPLMELWLMHDALRRALVPWRIQVERRLVGNFVTSLDMAGCSLTLTVVDDELLRLWDAPVHTPALRWCC